jgi:hypothetical protein
MYPNDGEAAEQLMECADLLMYENKKLSKLARKSAAQTAAASQRSEDETPVLTR